MISPVFMVTQSCEPSVFLPADSLSFEVINGLRSGKKVLRSTKPSLVILCVANEDDIQLCQGIAQYIRQGLANQDTRLVLIHQPALQLDEVLWLETFQINACLSAIAEKALFNATVLKREIATFQYIDNTCKQHDAETEMLVCITRFSRADENITALLSAFSAALASLCHACCSFEIYPENQAKFRVRSSGKDNIDILKTMQALMSGETLPACVSQAIDEKHPQISLLHDNAGLDLITRQLDTQIGSYLAFPVVVYKRVVCLLFYLIPESEMDRVSMKQITIINKAAEQLTVLLERKQAESSLKKQYQRLRDTLLELKSTKEALAHNEKLASIGRMAAGIAHEINNPLSFVISNFSSMDGYINNIIQLQSMQSELLTAIDIQQHQEAAHLKKSLNDFEQQAGIPFILDDIRAIVSDSFHGLQRVKNIITDLKSFSHNQAGEKAFCDLKAVLDESLKMLRYDIDSKVTITQDIQFSGLFYANAGLLEQILLNIIKNAIQAMTMSGTTSPTIVIVVTEKDDELEIRIRDNGPGMNESTKQKIFEPFFTTKPIGEGTGLGLSVVYNIVQRLQGRIICNTELGVYTEFAIFFPLKLNEETEMQ
ncbi:sensor histidine kinase [Aestuariibacter sp. GS-14]|uniref:sensor histidine kinase n=1 Tax=Aestuariibacter sp. GS-14 TaxID=2590670 RepID=UPI0015E85281|nr:ATP-binding protein [Aestuariibacter sp. GS-14]